MLDFGAGVGADVFMAAHSVGVGGWAVGVDVTVPMVHLAKSIATAHGYRNVGFVLGEIEQLPIKDESADAVVSNCVINTSPDKARVFRETHRVLKAGGRLVVCDVVCRQGLPDAIRDDPRAWAACIAGASDELELHDPCSRDIHTARST